MVLWTQYFPVSAKSTIHKTSFVSGKILEGSPCTPFDPAPLGLALTQAQGEELVSTPAFIQLVYKRQSELDIDND